MATLFSRLRPLLLAGIPLMLVADLYFGRMPREAPRADAGQTLPECPGWPGQVALDPLVLEAVSTPAWLALARGAPQVAIHEFQAQPTLDGRDRAGLLRAWVEWARALWAARELALSVERLQLDAELAGGLELVPGREVVPFLRASVALQAGEAVDVSPWLDRIPRGSPLARAGDVLREIAREPLMSGSTLPDTPGVRRPPRRAGGVGKGGPAAAAVQRWMRHLAGYARALEGLERCPIPYPGAAGMRARALADWAGREHPPDPVAWASLLGLQPPNPVSDFALGQCEGEAAALQLGMYDSSLYTALAGLALAQVERLEVRRPLARFARLQALELGDPGRARAEACTLEQAWSVVPRSTSALPLPPPWPSPPTAPSPPPWPSPPTAPSTAAVPEPEEDSSPWLVFSDWQDVAEMKAWTRQLCITGEGGRCPESASVWEANLAREQSAASLCYRAVAGRDRSAGELAEGWQLYGGIIRRRQLAPFLTGTCPDRALAQQAFTHWWAQATGEGRWQSLEALFGMVGSELGTPRSQEGAHQVYALATGDPDYGSIFHPLSELVRYASGLGVSPGERVYN